MLLLATRNGSSASVEMMKNRVDVVLTSIDRSRISDFLIIDSSIFFINL